MDNHLTQKVEAEENTQPKPFFQTVIAECFGPNRKFDVVGSWKDEFLGRSDVTHANVDRLKLCYSSADDVYNT